MAQLLSPEQLAQQVAGDADKSPAVGGSPEPTPPRVRKVSYLLISVGLEK